MIPGCECYLRAGYFFACYAEFRGDMSHEREQSLSCENRLGSPPGRGKRREALGWVVYVGGPTPAAFTTAVASAATPPLEGILAGQALLHYDSSTSFSPLIHV